MSNTLSQIIAGCRRSRRWLDSLHRATARVYGWFGDYADFPSLYAAEIAPKWPRLSQDPAFRRHLEMVHRREAEFCARPLSPADARRIELYRRLFGPDRGRNRRPGAEIVPVGPAQMPKTAGKREIIRNPAANLELLT